MVNKMKLEKLREALKRRDKEQLQSAIKDATAAGITSEHVLLQEAEIELDIINVREDLQSAITNKDADGIQTSMKKITESPLYHARLQTNLADARRELQRLERLYRLGSYILDMDKKTMGEMRRYQHPPKQVHRIMQAVMLLFKKDEEHTAKWPVCQQFLHPSGSEGMNRRVLDFSVRDVHPEIGARCQEILEGYDLSKVQDVSSGAATFYVWAKGVVEEMGPSIKVKPADAKRQIELFKPPPSMSPRRRRKGYDDPMTSPRK